MAELRRFGRGKLLYEYRGYGNLLAHLRNLPEMHELWKVYTFEEGSRGRGNGKSKCSPLGGSNIWLTDQHECVLIYQSEKGTGPLKVRVYTCTKTSTYLSDKVWQIIRENKLPHYRSKPGSL